MKTAMHTFALFCLVVGLGSCNKKKSNEVVEGYKPIYASAQNMEHLDIRANEALENPGRIYVYENYLLINDQSKGIHIFDNSNVNNPEQVSFIAIPGNMDFSVRGDKVYADNITDLVIVDISQPAAPEYKNRVKGVFPVQQFPDEFGAFECVDATQGVVVGWEKTTLTNPKCFK